MNFIVSASTDIGNVKHTNQDSYNVRVMTSPVGKAVLAVLCDGMGGLEKGEVASASLVNAFVKWADTSLGAILAGGMSDSAVANDWTRIVRVFNEKIKAYGRAIGGNVGTTVNALLLTDDRYYIINVGDTRTYEISDTVRVLTKDQTVVAREIELGNLTPEEAENDPRRSILLQCVGASETVEPEIIVGETRLGAVYMLCSDGFRHEISPDEIYGALNPDVMLDADGMKANIDYLIALDKQRQERDNITAIAIRTF